MDLTKLIYVGLLHEMVIIDTWISLSCYMDLSKLIFGFTWICQSCSITGCLVRWRGVRTKYFLSPKYSNTAEGVGDALGGDEQDRLLHLLDWEHQGGAG